MVSYRFCPVCGGPLTSRLLKAGEPERLVCTACGYVLYLDPKVAVGTIIAVNGTRGADGIAGAEGGDPSENERALRRETDLTAGSRVARPPGAHIVLVRRAIDPGYGLWVFPGGYVDRGEPPETAAIREAREECGLDIRLDRLVNIYSYPGRTPLIIVYSATMTGGTLCTDDECLEAGVFGPNEIPWDQLAFQSTRDALREYFDGHVSKLKAGLPKP
jgi:ADP-ribose pyrophosphatase YjhB (NUDIX family)/ribosomal protein S27AE